jgi:hypothetical protein
MDVVRKTSNQMDRRNQIVKIVVVLFALLFLFAGLNYRQLYSAWAVWSETRRLVNLAENDTEEFQNPASVEDRFEGRLSPAFWEFTIINGGGVVSNETAWHSTAFTTDRELTLQHSPDPFFKDEKPDRREPASELYNNVTLIGGSGFKPTPSADVVLKFRSKASDPFYGTAGVVFQPDGTLQEDGFFAKPFEMFGFAVVGEESSFNGNNDSLCYLALNWVPTKVESLNVDPHVWHDYEIRLHWVNKTEWIGTVSADDSALCQISMPAFGPVEVHVWSDNFLVIDQPRRWWELAPSLDLKFQDGGKKQFLLDMIQIFEEAR